MAIPFSCSCGKAMKAKEAFAGRKIRCAQCGKVVTIPQAKIVPADDDKETPSEPPLAKPAARPVLTKAKAEAPPIPPAPAPTGVHVWVDRSLVQQPTPWLPGDEDRFQRGIKVPREGLSGMEAALAALLLIGGLGVAGWFLIGR
jgi:hypothetical protein